jgi:hypothetical protein
MESHSGMISKDETPESSTRALWKSCQQSPGSNHEERAMEIMNLALEVYIVYTFK